MVQGDPSRRNPIAFPIIDYDLTTSEKEENLDEEENEAENDIHLNDDEILTLVVTSKDKIRWLQRIYF